MHSGLGTSNTKPIDERIPAQSELNLGQLRATIKKVMIPLLIRIFELKLAAQQANTPPSRLQKKQDESVEEILSQLHILEEELKLLELWCHSCQKQVERAIGEISPSASPTLPSPRYSQTAPPSHPKQQTSSNWLSKFLKK